MPRRDSPLVLLFLASLIAAKVQAREWDPASLPQNIQVDTVQQTTKILEGKSRDASIHDIATFSDYRNRVVAYRDRKERMCYLERMTAGSLQQQLRLLSARYMRALPPRLERTLYAAPGKLSKTEVWELAGRRVAEFCRGLTAALLLPGPPHAIVNELPEGEGDVQANPEAAAKLSTRPQFLEQHRDTVRRTKRQASSGSRTYPRRYRGQSQSQFVAFRGGEGSPGGIAEGTSQHDRSVARVSATSGMGQAQSQSSFDDDCEGCNGRGGGYVQPPEPLGRPGYSGGGYQARPGTSGYPIGGQLTPGYPTYSGGQLTPGYTSGGQSYPGQAGGRPVGPGSFTPGGSGYVSQGGTGQGGVRPGGGYTSQQIPGQQAPGYGSGGQLTPGYTNGRPGGYQGPYQGPQIPAYTPGGGQLTPSYTNGHARPGQTGGSAVQGPYPHGQGQQIPGGYSPGGAQLTPGYTNGQSRPGHAGGGPAYQGTYQGQQPGQGQSTPGYTNGQVRPDIPGGPRYQGQQIPGQGVHLSPGGQSTPGYTHVAQVRPGQVGGGPSYQVSQIPGHGHQVPGQSQLSTGGQATPGYTSGVQIPPGQPGFTGGGPGHQVPQIPGQQTPVQGSGRQHGYTNGGQIRPGQTDGRPSYQGPYQGQHIPGQGQQVPSYTPGYTNGGQIRPGQSSGPGYHPQQIPVPGSGQQIPGGQLTPGYTIGGQLRPDQPAYIGGGPGYQGQQTPGYIDGGQHIGAGPAYQGQQTPGYTDGGQPRPGHSQQVPGYGGGHLTPGYTDGGPAYQPPGQIPTGPLTAGVRPAGPDYGGQLTPGYQIPGHGTLPVGPPATFLPGAQIPGQTYPPHQGQTYLPHQGPGYYQGPGSQYGPGQYPGGGQSGQYPQPSQGGGVPGGQYDGGVQYPLPGYGVGGQYPIGTPGQEVHYPGSISPTQLVQQTEDGRSQVKTSVLQDNNETLASSSAQGLHGEGRAQTQVSGSYKGSGSFSAQAQTSDRNRGAQSQVLGGSDGATSSGQAQGGSGQSQAEVKLASESGLTIAGSQTSSSQFNTQSEVQAGEMGGNADAQASGQGNSQSQAQVGFRPYQSSRDNDDQRVPFRGGGSASSQTGSYSGSSQTQVQGAFRYGISYTGAAQASTGTSDKAAKDGGTALEPFKKLSFSKDEIAATETPSSRQSGRSETPDLSAGEQRPGLLQQGSAGQTVSRTSQAHRASSAHEDSFRTSGGQSHGIQNGQRGAHEESLRTSGGLSNGAQNGQRGSSAHEESLRTSGGLSNGAQNGQRGSSAHEESFRSSRGQSNGAQIGYGTPIPIDMTPQLTPVDILPAASNGQRSSSSHTSSHREEHQTYVKGGSQHVTSSSQPQQRLSGGGAGGGPAYQATQYQDGQRGGYSNGNTIGSQLPTQQQSVILGNLDNYGVQVIQDADGTGLSTGDVLQPGHVIPGRPGYVIPGGFRGRVVSTAGDHASASSTPGGQAQTQTVILTPGGGGNISYTGPAYADKYDDEDEDESDEEGDYPDRPESPPQDYYPRNGHNTRTYRPAPTYGQNGNGRTTTIQRGVQKQNGGSQVRNGGARPQGVDDYDVRPAPAPDSYVSVTKSVTGQLDNKGGATSLDGSKYAHTYYTKSSTCGYFTFSCNIVYGSNGRTKICKPKGQTNPDGTPCCC